MKKLGLQVFFILMILTLGSVLAHAEGMQMRFGQINKDAKADLTYLRLKPSDDADVIIGYYKGTFLMILGEDTNGWCHVSIGNQQGYVKKDEIMASDAFSGTATLPVIRIKPESKSGWVNLRVAPSLDAEGLIRLPMDETAILLGITDEWCHVMVQDMLGFVKTEFTEYADENIELKASELKVALYDDGGKKQSTPSSGTKAATQQSAGSSTQTTSGAGSSAGKGYEMKLYTEAPNSKSTVSIEYPYFSNNDALNAIVEQKIQNILKYPSSYYPQFGFTAIYKATVTLDNSRMVSILFVGTVEIEKGQSGTAVATLNVDLSSMKALTLSDLYRISEDFEKHYLEKAYFPSKPMVAYNASQFKELLLLQSRENNLVGPFAAMEDVFCFLKPDGIVICVPASGSDYFEAQLNYSDIQQFYLPSRNYW